MLSRRRVLVEGVDDGHLGADGVERSPQMPRRVAHGPAVEDAGGGDAPSRCRPRIAMSHDELELRGEHFGDDLPNTPPDGFGRLPAEDSDLACGEPLAVDRADEDAVLGHHES